MFIDTLTTRESNAIFFPYQISEEGMDMIAEQTSETSNEQHIVVELAEHIRQDKTQMLIQPVDEQVVEEVIEHIAVEVKFPFTICQEILK